jgi:hypothetical protein
MEKRCVVLPRFRTTNRTVEPAGTTRRESRNEKSLASTRTVTVACGRGAADPARAAARTRPVPTTAAERRRCPCTARERYAHEHGVVRPLTDL